MANDQVSVEISIEEKAALKALTQLTRGMDNVEKSATKSVGKMDAAFASFAGNLASNLAGKAIIAVVDGFKSLGGVVTDSIKLANIQEDAIKKLNVALSASGQYTKETSKSFQQFASEMQKITKYGDEVILENAALIQSLGQLDQDGLKAATKASLDLASALGISLNTAALLVGKAAAGEVGTFSRYGLIIKKGADNAETFANALDGINRKFGGAAAAQVDTFSGAVDQLSNSWGDAKEQIGFAFTQNELIKSSIKELNKLVVELGDDISKVAPGMVSSFVSVAKATKDWFFETEADAKFAKSGIEGLRTEIKNLESRAIAIRENRFNLPDFLLADINETNTKIDLYKTKLSEVLSAEKNLVMLRSSNADVMQSATEALIGRSDFVTTNGGVGGDASSNPRVIQEKQVSEKILQERAKLRSDIMLLEQDAYAVEAERKLAQQGLDVEQRAMLLEQIKFHEIQKADIALNAELEKNKAISDAQAKALADKKAFAANELAVSRAQATAEQKIAQERVRNQEQMVSGFATAITQASNLARKGTNEQKILAAASATINTYAAATRAFRDYPYPANIAVMATTIAAGLQQVSQIQKQSFQTGGVVGGFSGATNGTDNTTANVRTGEMVLNGAQQKQLFDVATGRTSTGSEGLIDAVNKLANQAVIVQVDGREIARTVRDQRVEGFQ